MSNNYNKNTVRLRRDKYRSTRSTLGTTSNASRVYNYELMLQLYYITRQEAALPKQSKAKVFVPAEMNAGISSN